jgi:hypothetical protein
MIDCTILNSFMHSYLPDLYEHLMSHGFELNLNNFIYKWLVSLFIQNFPEDFSFAIWDYLFLDGNIVVFKASLSIFIILKKTIMRNTNFEMIYEILSKGTNDISDFHILLYYLALKHFEFDYNFINKNRFLLFKPVTDSMLLENNNKGLSNLSNNKAVCNKDWPFCTELNHIKTYTVNSLVLYTGERIVIYEDYFFMLCNEKFNLDRSITYKSIPIERKFHLCKCQSDSITTSESVDDEYSKSNCF